MDVYSHTRMTTASCVIPDFTQDKRTWMFCGTPKLISVVPEGIVEFTSEQVHHLKPGYCQCLLDLKSSVHYFIGFHF